LHYPRRPREPRPESAAAAAAAAATAEEEAALSETESDTERRGARTYVESGLNRTGQGYVSTTKRGPTNSSSCCLFGGSGSSSQQQQHQSSSARRWRGAARERGVCVRVGRPPAGPGPTMGEVTNRGIRQGGVARLICRQRRRRGGRRGRLPRSCGGPAGGPAASACD
jgi:hypothetical protein